MKKGIFFLLSLLAGLFLATHQPRVEVASKSEPEKSYPITENKSFVIFIYAHNWADWCERALRSVFEQRYDHYRVIMIDDASKDETANLAKEFIIQNNQDEKVVFIQNEKHLGKCASLYRVIDTCLDREIIIEVDAKNWLSSPLSLAKLNETYQNPDVWMVKADGLLYPSYERKKKALLSYYSAIFKEIKLEDLLKENEFIQDPALYAYQVKALSGDHFAEKNEPLFFENQATFQRINKQRSPENSIIALKEFPKQKMGKKASIVIFSEDTPNQLFRSLQSIGQMVTGFDQLTVFYHFSPEKKGAYEEVKKSFPDIDFIFFTEKTLKPFLCDLLFKRQDSDYVLFASDQKIFTDFVDLTRSLELLQKTDAFSFYLNPVIALHEKGSNPIFSDVCALSLDEMDLSSFEMGLYKKTDLIKELKFQSILDLQNEWLSKAPQKAACLYFESSKTE